MAKSLDRVANHCQNNPYQRMETGEQGKDCIWAPSIGDGMEAGLTLSRGIVTTPFIPAPTSWWHWATGFPPTLVRELKDGGRKASEKGPQTGMREAGVAQVGPWRAWPWVWLVSSLALTRQLLLWLSIHRSLTVLSAPRQGLGTSTKKRSEQYWLAINTIY